MTKEQIKKIGNILFHKYYWHQKEINKIEEIISAYEEMKQLELTAVGNRRELLIAYEKKRSETILTGDTDEEIVDQIICNL
jgi:lipopolysaccharide biosynthesis protein